ncbi:MAG TPA: hypothetical protein EYQ24_08215 [Bacteroidetes bacterium]|nr:hypothetical protein [Bacteroidota bacterium]
MPGLRTVFLTIVGGLLTVPLVDRVIAVGDEHLAETLEALALVLGPLFLLYPLSKAASRLRDWGGARHGARDDPFGGADPLDGDPDAPLLPDDPDGVP